MGWIIAYTTNVEHAVKLLRLTPTPTPFRVEPRKRFWGESLPSSQPALVPSVLVYGDLLRYGDARAVETARSATVRSPAPSSHPRNTSLISTTLTSLNPMTADLRDGNTDTTIKRAIPGPTRQTRRVVP